MSIARRIAVTWLLFGVGRRDRLPVWRRSWARRRSTSGASSTPRCRSPTTPTRRSSSSPGCRACWPAPWWDRRWPRRASCCRRCFAIRWQRRLRSACRPAPRSARCWRSRSTCPRASPDSRPCRWPASPARLAPSPSCTASRARGIAASRPTCCCSPASR